MLRLRREPGRSRNAADRLPVHGPAEHGGIQLGCTISMRDGTTLSNWAGSTQPDSIIPDPYNPLD